MEDFALLLQRERILECFNVLFGDVFFADVAECLEDKAADFPGKLHPLGAGFAQFYALVADGGFLADPISQKDDLHGNLFAEVEPIRCISSGLLQADPFTASYGGSDFLQIGAKFSEYWTGARVFVKTSGDTAELAVLGEPGEGIVDVTPTAKIHKVFLGCDVTPPSSVESA